MAFVFFWFTSFNIISSCIHVAASSAFHSVSWLSSIPLCIHTTSSVSADVHLGGFHVLAIVNSAGRNIGCVYVFEL